MAVGGWRSEDNGVGCCELRDVFGIWDIERGVCLLLKKDSCESVKFQKIFIWFKL